MPLIYRNTSSYFKRIDYGDKAMKVMLFALSSPKDSYTTVEPHKRHTPHLARVPYKQGFLYLKGKEKYDTFLTSELPSHEFQLKTRT